MEMASFLLRRKGVHRGRTENAQVAVLRSHSTEEDKNQTKHTTLTPRETGSKKGISKKNRPDIHPPLKERKSPHKTGIKKSWTHQTHQKKEELKPPQQ